MGNKQHRSLDEQVREEIGRSKKIDTTNQQDQLVNMEYTKLLLLGAGESGKSTIFKQIVTLYGKGYSEDDRKKYIDLIHANIIGSIQSILHATDNLNRQFPELNTVISSDLSVQKEFLLRLDPGENAACVTPEVVSAWKELWKDSGIQLTYEHRNKFQIPDSALYFFEKLDDIIRPGYIPTVDDLIRSRARSTGIIETEFQVMESKFQLFDVGGQRSERKKWIHCFENVKAVLFVAAISEFDQFCLEDEKTNRIQEALTLFGDVCSSQYLCKTSMMLFLNKDDLFREKLGKVNLRDFDSTYTGNSYEDAIEHMKQLFLAQNENPTRQIFTHVTCATNRENVKFVFESVKTIILNISLQEGGM